MADWSERVRRGMQMINKAIMNCLDNVGIKMLLGASIVAGVVLFPVAALSVVGALAAISAGAIAALPAYWGYCLFRAWRTGQKVKFY